MRCDGFCAYSCFIAGICPTKKERSEKLLDREIEPRDSGSVEETFALPADTGWESLLSLTGQEVHAILAGAQERASIEAEDFWEQGEEACSVDPTG